MPTYAIVGSTGNCGTALIENLLQRPGVRIHAFCRNRPKLLAKFQHLSEDKRVEIFEGNIQDVDLMCRCIGSSKAIFHVASTNDNVPGYSLGFQTATTIIQAIAKLKERNARADLPTPKIILLSSATIDKHLSRNVPWLIRQILLRSASNVYKDLRRTENFLRAHQDTVVTIFIKPGGLSKDAQRGHKLDLEHEESFLSYLDLGAAMIEAADDVHGAYDMKNVSVVNANGRSKFPVSTLACVFIGLLRHYFPLLHPYLPTTGP